MADDKQWYNKQQPAGNGPKPSGKRPEGKKAAQKKPMGKKPAGKAPHAAPNQPGKPSDKKMQKPGVKPNASHQGKPVQANKSDKRNPAPKSKAEIKRLKEQKKAGGYPDTEGLDVITSGLTRTEQTLSILFGNVPHRTDKAFSEMDFGAFEGYSYDQLKDRADYQEWISGDHMAKRCPGGESGNIMKERVLRGIDDVLKGGRDTLIVCHGGVIAILFEHFFPNTGLNWYEMLEED